jgi:hypothetical protein
LAVQFTLGRLVNNEQMITALKSIQCNKNK